MMKEQKKREDEYYKQLYTLVKYMLHICMSVCMQARLFIKREMKESKLVKIG